MKHKTSPARLAQLLQPSLKSLAFCFSLQPMTAGVPSRTGRYAVIGCKLKQEAQLLLGDRATRKHAKDC